MAKYNKRDKRGRFTKSELSGSRDVEFGAVYRHALFGETAIYLGVRREGNPALLCIDKYRGEESICLEDSYPGFWQEFYKIA